MKVYWSRCGHGHGNFGDKLTPLLLKHFGVPVEWAPVEHAELIGVGSILVHNAYHAGQIVKLRERWAADGGK